MNERKKSKVIYKLILANREEAKDAPEQILNMRSSIDTNNGMIETVVHNDNNVNIMIASYDDIKQRHKQQLQESIKRRAGLKSELIQNKKLALDVNYYTE